MALDPSIPLQGGTVPDLLSAVQGGLSLSQQIRNQPLREALMRRQAEQLESNQARLQQTRFIGTPQRVTKEGQNFLIGLTQDPTGQIRLSETPVQGEFVSGMGETAQDLLVREVEEARRKAEIAAQSEGRKVQTKGISERQQVAIDKGLDATESVSDIGRAFELLQTVNTGRPQEALLGAKKFFGIDAADEGELKSILGRAVIANLRASFGGNPTEGERAALAEVENSFSQQGEVNIRLLNRTLGKLERNIERGIEAAKRSEDGFSLEKLTQVREQISSIKSMQASPAQDLKSLSNEDLLKGL